MSVFGRGKFFVAVVTTALAAGCGAQALVAPLSADHPASPDAPEAAVVEPGRALSTAPSAPAEHPHDGGAGQ